MKKLCKVFAIMLLIALAVEAMPSVYSEAACVHSIRQREYFHDYEVVTEVYYDCGGGVTGSGYYHQCYRVLYGDLYCTKCGTTFSTHEIGIPYLVRSYIEPKWWSPAPPVAPQGSGIRG